MQKESTVDLDKSLTSIYFESTKVKARGIDRFQMFGERRSGTNFVRELVQTNFNVQTTWRFGWKHGIPHFPVLPKRCLFVVVVRDPFDWAVSLFNGAYEAHPVVKNRDFDAFLREEWVGQFRPAKSPWHKVGYDFDPSVGRGEELQLDRHPIEGRRFKSIFEMRSVKYRSFLGLLERDVNVAIIRFEDALNKPQAVCKKISNTFGLKLRGFSPVVGHVGPKGLRKGLNRVSELTDHQRAYIFAQLDNDLEHRFGYV